MKKYVFASALTLLLASCADDDVKGTPAEGEEFVPTERQAITLSRTEQEMVDCTADFAFKLFADAMADTVYEDNVVFAPYSLTGALAMVANSATSTGAEAISSVIGWSRANDVNETNSLYQRLTKELLSADNQVKMSIANSAWVNPSMDFAGDFKTQIETYYQAATFKSDLCTAEGVAQFNNWCSEATNGMITHVLDLQKYFFGLVASVNYFDGKWKTPFDKSLTADGMFTASDGSKSTVKMMRQIGPAFSSGLGCKAVTLPYGNGAFRMTILLPDENETVSTVAQKLTASNLKALVTKPTGICNLELPRFTAEYTSMNMIDMIKDLPLLSLPYFATVSGEPYSELTLTKIHHTVKVEVDEEGTQAAAVTTIPAATVALSATVKCNRAFIFIIDEESTGAVLFIGVVNKI